MPRKKDIAKIDKAKPIRVRPTDIQNAIFPLNIKRKQDIFNPSHKKIRSVVKFTIFGQHSNIVDITGDPIENGFPETNDDEKCMARVDYTNPPRYYVKVNPQGLLYNPMGILDEGTLNKDLKYKKQWQFREVNKKVFNFYLNFLKTKNPLWINNANRELF